MSTINYLLTTHHHQVLSAAHCMHKAPATTFVTLGMHKIRLDADDDFSKIEHIPIEKSEVHPLYNSETRKFDFWMIKLMWATQKYKNSVLDRLHRNTAGDFVLNADSDIELTTIGFGTTEQGGVPPDVLQKVTLKYITNDACTHAPYKYATDEILDSMLCTVTNDPDVPKDTCQASVVLRMHTRLFVLSCVCPAASYLV
jgi:hypothetical protein